MTRLTRGRHVARLLDGPLAGSLVRLPRSDDGEPVDELPIDGQHDGAYQLAGLPGNRGIVPYRWFTHEEKAKFRRWLRHRVHRG